MALAPVAGALGGRFGLVRVSVAGLSFAAAGLAVEGLAAGTLWALVVASAVFVAGGAAAVPNMISLFGARAGKARAAGIALNGFMLFAGASVGQLLTQLPLGFTALLLALAALLLGSAALVAISSPAPATAGTGDPSTSR